MDNRDKIFTYTIKQLQKIIIKLEETQDKEYDNKYRMADFAVFALKTAENEQVQKELEEIFAKMIKIQNEFTLKDDVLYTVLSNFARNKDHKGKRFTPAELYRLFKLEAEGLGLEKPFEAVYKNPKSVSTRLRNIKDNLSDEILIYYKKGHRNQYYYTYELVDESEYQDPLI